MGLSAPRKRVKISHDPNNTTWSTSTSNFGHRILTSQGWTPGEYLGAKDAPHAQFHTAANKSHIRVAIKDDNLGLGATVRSHGECTGLDVFQDLLGRLNGRSEEDLEGEKKGREQGKRRIYAERKFGGMRFVHGGHLVGDKIQVLIEGERERLRALEEADLPGPPSEMVSEGELLVEMVKKAKKPKKRKAEVIDENPAEVVAIKIKKTKKKKKSDSNSEETEVLAAALEDVKVSKKKKEKKSLSTPAVEDDDCKRRKREKKEKKRKKRTEDGDEVTPATSITGASTETTTKESTPIGTPLPSAMSSGRSTPLLLQGRHQVRSRHIAQKRLASMDVASLNQIFMIKSQT